MPQDHPVSDRRRGPDPDYDGAERRRTYDERRQDFTLIRERVLLVVGIVGLLGITGAAVTVGFKDPAVALATLPLFAALLGAPTFMKLDEARERRRNGS